MIVKEQSTIGEITMAHPVKHVRPMSTPWQTQDPFLFSMHHLDHYPAGNEEMGPSTGLAGRNIGQDFANKDGWNMYHGQKVPGFPYHPHRGFETITIVEQGLADHSDSLGSTGRFGNGDVQWMTAGKGVQHSEMFPLLESDKPNTGELFQIWLNLPSKDKLVEPDYKMLWSEDIPVVKENDENGKEISIKVVAGDYKEHKAPDPTPNSWAKDPNNSVKIYRIELEEGATWRLPADEKDVNRTLYFYQGEKAVVADQVVDGYHQVELHSTETAEIKAIDGPVKFILLQGRPIGEAVAQYGPFVMNTQQELQEAFQEYNKTEFGGWPWPEREMVHPREKGRFAKYGDGRVEER